MCALTKFNLLLLLCGFVAIQAQALQKEAYMTVPQIIKAAGYPVEKFRAKTVDGYVLQLHRIPAGRRTIRRSRDPSSKGKKAVLIVHGLLGSSSDFVIMGPDRSLAYILADAGYDVWLGNLRGNSYTTHQNLSRSDPKFWEYSFHEHGGRDLPALIDKVLEVTGLPRLIYIGYSMGTTTFFTMMSQRPEYNDKLISCVAMAPAVYLDHVKPLAELTLKTINMPETMRSRGMIAVNLRPEMMEMMISTVCNMRRPQEDVCLRAVYFIVGEDYEQNDADILPVITLRLQPASWRQLEHFGKIAITGVFTSWEDGLWGAVKAYDLSKVRVPVTLLYGENDQLTEKSQVMRLAAQLNESGALEAVRPACSWPKFNHLDFVFAKDVGKLLNRPLVKHIDYLFNKYDP